MAIYRNIQLSFWTDNKVEDDFTPEDKYFYLYLLTNPQTNICGCYEISYGQVAHQTGYNKETILRLLKRFEEVHKVLKFCEETKEVLILHWHKYNWTASKDLMSGVSKVARHIKCDEFREYVYSILEEIAARKNGANTDSIPRGVDRPKTVSRPSVDPRETSVSDTVINTKDYVDSKLEVNSKSYKEKKVNNSNTVNHIELTSIYKNLNYLFNKYNIQGELEEALEEWLRYKKERNFAYKDTGLNTLVKTASANAAQFGADAVVTTINECIASGYQGIMFNQIKRHKSDGKRDILQEWRDA